MVTRNLAWIIIIPLCVALGHARFHKIDFLKKANEFLFSLPFTFCIIELSNFAKIGQNSFLK